MSKQPTEIELPPLPEDEIALDTWIEWDTPGLIVQGILLRCMEVESRTARAGHLTQALILTPDGLARFNLTAQTALLANLPAGTRMTILYTGERANPGANPIKTFRLSMKRTDWTALLQDASRLQLLAAPPRIQADSDPFGDDDTQPPPEPPAPRR